MSDDSTIWSIAQSQRNAFEKTPARQSLTGNYFILNTCKVISFRFAVTDYWRFSILYILIHQQKICWVISVHSFSDSIILDIKITRNLLIHDKQTNTISAPLTQSSLLKHSSRYSFISAKLIDGLATKIKSVN